jgi:hypothetical protein
LTKPIQLKEDTKEDFDNLKAMIAETMSADEFMRVLLAAYRSQKVRAVAR